MEFATAYIPIDRRFALAAEKPLVDRCRGTAIFVDISGFTSLTVALTQKSGPVEGTETLTGWLNKVYDILIGKVHHYGGSVVNFSGDAITCWFSGDNGHRAISCALALQASSMSHFETDFSYLNLRHKLGIKVAIAHGTVRRFVVGHPYIQTIEVLAGRPLSRMALIEHKLRAGEVGICRELAENLDSMVKIQEWRTASNKQLAIEKFAVVNTLHPFAAPSPWLNLPPLESSHIRTWLLSSVFQRVQRQEEFLGKMCFAVPLFLNFDGIDYDQDDDAQQKLDKFIRWVQRILAIYQGTLLQLTFGDKGSYLYAIFGVPTNCKNGANRAVAAALELISPPPQLDYIQNIRIGISQGQLRAGAYGGTTRRTYGVLGNEVNIAARLMTQAEEGSQILVTKEVADAVASKYEVKKLGLVALKGQLKPTLIFKVLGKSVKLTSYNSAPTISLRWLQFDYHALA